MLEVGSLVDGKYRILQKIGQGGMSVVYLARNERANKQWAIKEVRKDGVHDYEVVKQGLVAEIDMLKRLNHPHLPSIIDVIDSTDSFIIVMDYIEGNPLDKAIEATGAQSQENVIDWAKQLCDTLSYLHSRTPPIIYRDMKPSNVMIKPDGQVVLIDFGTAREYKNTSVADTTCLGTRGYAAPEQFGGMGQTDARTDIYCLGATMYHLVTGHNPCTYPYEMKPIREWNPQLSTGLESIILKCTQSNPDDRYQSCAELYYDLEHYKDLDYENMRKNNIRWKLFLISCIMTIFMAGGTVAAAIGSNSLKSSTYESYLKKGNESSDFDDKIENYQQAIKLMPSDSEAYMKILDVMTDDRIGDEYFTDEEYDLLRNKVLEHSNVDFGNKTNISILEKENPEGYAKFASELGYACFFECKDIDESNAASRAKTWFDNALRVGKLNSTEESRARIVSTLVQNRDDITRKKKDGTTLITHAEYWSSIIEILDESEDVSSLMQLRMQRFALTEIVARAEGFLLGGITEEEMQAKVIDRAKDICEKLDSKGEFNDTTSEEYKLFRTIYDGNGITKPLVEQAQNAIANAQLTIEKRNANSHKTNDQEGTE